MKRRLLLGAMTVAVLPQVLAETITRAAYAEPVERYGHYALGIPHEYGRMTARTDTGRRLVLDLPAHEVFEDLAPRLVRLTKVSPVVVLAIASERERGSRLVLVGIKDGRLQIVAQSDPIGTPNRWLNPVGVADLDGDGIAEIAAVTTPHIGGVLRVYRRDGERLIEIASLAGFSNHVYGSSELGLSRPAMFRGQLLLLVPDARRTSVRVIALQGTRLVEIARCALSEPITGPAALRESGLESGMPCLPSVRR